MESPVRGSATDGGSGASSPGEKPWNTFTLSRKVFCCEALVRRCASFFDTTIGASDVVSEPTAMALSISPAAIFAALPSAPCRLVPHACMIVMPGVEGASSVPSTASRVRLKSFECVTTAPPTTSSMCWPFRL